LPPLSPIPRAALEDARTKQLGGWYTGLARIGAVLYVLWGLVHYNAAYGVYQFAQSTPLTIEYGRQEQLAFYVARFATAGIVLATLNWRNSPLGFWCNAVIVGIGDIPFILFVLVPGYVPLWPGIGGRYCGSQP
jgi:hypothetical protein